MKLRLLQSVFFFFLDPPLYGLTPPFISPSLLLSGYAFSGWMTEDAYPFRHFFCHHLIMKRGFGISLLFRLVIHHLMWLILGRNT